MLGVGCALGGGGGGGQGNATELLHLWWGSSNQGSSRDTIKALVHIPPPLLRPRPPLPPACPRQMKKGARIINVARGGVIDDDALVRAMDAGIVAGAALDVFEIEPPAADNPLVGRPDVICTPHLGASTKEAQEEVAYEIAEAVISALKVGVWSVCGRCVSGGHC